MLRGVEQYLPFVPDARTLTRTQIPLVASHEPGDLMLRA